MCFGLVDKSFGSLMHPRKSRARSRQEPALPFPLSATKLSRACRIRADRVSPLCLAANSISVSRASGSFRAIVFILPPTIIQFCHYGITSESRLSSRALSLRAVAHTRAQQGIPLQTGHRSRARIKLSRALFTGTARCPPTTETSVAPIRVFSISLQDLRNTLYFGFESRILPGPVITYRKTETLYHQSRSIRVAVY